MYLYHNIKKDPSIDVTSTQQQNMMVQEMKQQFTSFGYQEVRTPAFQPYDLYVQMNGTVNQQEMIKTIDSSGNVLVLRPDVTIPLTQQLAMTHSQLQQELRYFYVLDVFRQTARSSGNQENAQIGAEFFGNTTAEADAEIIALSMNVLHAIDLGNVKIELGHSGFFKELIAEMQLNKETLKDLKKSIRAKNVPEIETMLEPLDIDERLKEIVTSLPFLYGKPVEVIEQAKKLPLSNAMQETLNNIADIYEYLEVYGMAEHIIVDLSLINHMDYYSDIIFQGFIQHAGKPVLMGGRYNTLANQFGADIPAVGFACNLDLLLEHTDVPGYTSSNSLDICILHSSKTIKKEIALANELRQLGYRTAIYSKAPAEMMTPDAKAVIQVEEDTYVLKHDDEMTRYPSSTALIASLQKEK